MTHRQRADNYAAELQRVNKSNVELETMIADCKDVFDSENSAAVESYATYFQNKFGKKLSWHIRRDPKPSQTEITDTGGPNDLTHVGSEVSGSEDEAADEQQVEHQLEEENDEKDLKVQLEQREVYMSYLREEKAEHDTVVEGLEKQRDKAREELEACNRSIEMGRAEHERHMKKRAATIQEVLSTKNQRIKALEAEPAKLRKMLSEKANDELLAADKGPDSVAKLQKNLGYEKKRRLEVETMLGEDAKRSKCCEPKLDL
ncbi:hypothetical protein LTR37_018048 [Vermiconidia calcicola]|uniref:Uncharacterized protein n=1 Tax=Vermiconidia calcicola TaxID=1690605 RepID=A0ACC3MI76_9PEZI|nr:hypothetical protein LTR37_018048 [Vermiconidia calcicola]